MEYIEPIITFFKNQIPSMFSVAFATFFGAWAAFQLNKSHEKTKKEDKNFTAGKHAQFVLSCQYTWLSNLKSQALEGKKNDPLRHLSLHPYSTSTNIPTLDMNTLLFMLDGEGAQLLNEITVGDRKFHTVITALELRNSKHLDFQNRAAKESPEKALDDATIKLLIDYTNSLFDTVDAAYKMNKELSHKLEMYLKNEFPDKKPLTIEYDL